MWLYMVSFYVEASAETKHRRLPYLGASLFVLLLFTTSSIIEGIGVYHLLFESSSSAENAKDTITALVKYVESPRATAVGLTIDWSLQFADLVLVSMAQSPIKLHTDKVSFPAVTSSGIIAAGW